MEDDVMVDTKKNNYAEIGRRMRALPLEKPAPSHEWDELVQKMCSSDDVELRDIGHKENEILKLNNSKYIETKKQ